MSSPTIARWQNLQRHPSPTCPCLLVRNQEVLPYPGSVPGKWWSGQQACRSALLSPTTDT
jgi:hypothetical protein